MDGTVTKFNKTEHGELNDNPKGEISDKNQKRYWKRRDPLPEQIILNTEPEKPAAWFIKNSTTCYSSSTNLKS